jgi:hypothetical protein
VSGGSEPV